jgi:hypothetical protein
MSDYIPDRWVVLQFDNKGDIIRKVFAGWYGGYLEGDSWKLSSGITETREFDDRYEFDNISGSLYICYKHSYGMSGYQTNIFSSFERQIAEDNDDTIIMKLIEDYYENKRNV